MEDILCKGAGERILQIRKARGYTRDELAEKAVISSKFLYEIEQGRKKFSAEALCHIARALEVSCDYIMFGEEAMETEVNGVLETFYLFNQKQRKNIIPLLKVIHGFLK